MSLLVYNAVVYMVFFEVFRSRLTAYTFADRFSKFYIELFI